MNGSQVVTATFTQDQYTLTVHTVGNGAVTVDPDQPTYVYSDVVTLTATPDPGWTFAGWSGDLSGTDNPATLTITGHTTITATFTQDEYSLTVHTVGNGAVAQDPDQPTYVYGDVVTLTATADPGWTFADWSGDLSSTDNPVTITVTGNHVITATFTQDEYTLTVHTVGNGAVAVEPDQPTYIYGDVVTLTATAGPEWSFTGWSGDLSGSDNPALLTMTGNMVVTATFANHPPVLDPIGDQVVNSGAVLSFTVSATDPDGVTPSLSVENLPLGADFTDNGNGTALFSWQTTSADRGVHIVTFIASDGVLTASQVVTIAVVDYQIFLPFLARDHPAALVTTSTQPAVKRLASHPAGGKDKVLVAKRR
jgi:uncharacterized repeat protein (TIGR02543 family)